jgi:hypothetical protein
MTQSWHGWVAYSHVGPEKAVAQLALAPLTQVLLSPVGQPEQGRSHGDNLLQCHHRLAHLGIASNEVPHGGHNMREY